MRGKTCGGCNLRLQYKCRKLCNCFHKRENLRWLQYTSAGSYATADVRGKACGGYNTSVVNCATATMRGNAIAGNYATAAISGKNYGGCNIQSREIIQLLPCAGKPVVVALQARENLRRLKYKHGKLCNCCNAQQSLWWLQYKRGKYATGAMRGKNCGGFKRETMQLVLSAGKHANCRCKHTACFTREKRALALTCSLRTVWTSEGVSWTVYQFFHDKLKLNL